MIYFIQAEGHGIKIGYSSQSAESRLRHLQTSSPFPLYILAEMDGDLATEKSLHRKFASQRIHGEWFRANRKLLNFIRTLPAYKPVARAKREKDAFGTPEQNFIELAIHYDSDGCPSLVLEDKGVRQLISWSSRVAGSQTEWARRNGLSQAYVTHVAKGIFGPGPKILAALGLKKVIQYERI